jgi:hypothetical protein
MRGTTIIDLYEKLTTGQQAGVVWALKQGNALNVNLVRFPMGRASASTLTERSTCL